MRWVGRTFSERGIPFSLLRQTSSDCLDASCVARDAGDVEPRRPTKAPLPLMANRLPDSETASLPAIAVLPPVL